MTHFDNLRYALNFILDLPAADRVGAGQSSAIVWQLDIVDSNNFEANLDALPNPADPKLFKVSISSSVWPRLEAFCACGMDWPADSPDPIQKSFSYSDAQWETLIRLTEDGTDWATLENKVKPLTRKAETEKRIVSPLSLIPLNQTPAQVVAACCGFCWLIGHEGTHAWKRHYKLQDISFRESIRKLSCDFVGLGVDCTSESEADWQATKGLYAYVLDCVLLGYDCGLAYLAGFGIVAAILLLDPTRHDMWERAEQQDPGWMRVHGVQDAAKSAYWWVTEGYFPKYVSAVRKFGASAALRPDLNEISPGSQYFQRTEKVLKAFSLGQLHALRFAHTISEANERLGVVSASHFRLGDPSEWKDFQAMVIESDVLKQRKSARKRLREYLVEDPRFGGLALSYDAHVRLALLASKNLPEDGLRERGRESH